MPQIIDVPGHGQVEFPDGMSDDQIVSAIRRNSQPTPQPNIAAGNPEVNLPFGMKISGESDSGFNPAAMLIKAGATLNRINQGVTSAMRAPFDAGMLAVGAGRDPMSAAIDKEQQYSAQPIKDLQDIHPGSTALGDVLALAPMPMRALPAIAAAEYGSPTERLARGGAALAGNALVKGAANLAAKRYASSQAQAADNVAANASVQPFKDAGYSMPPAQVNPTLPNQILEGLSGGAKTEQAASRVNEMLPANAAKEVLGLPKTAQLSPELLDSFRAKQYQTGYVPVKEVPQFTSDAQFATDIASLKPAIDKEIPELANAQIGKTIAALSKPGFSGSTAVDLTRRLRSDARSNFKAFDDPEKQALAQVQRGAADAVEGLIERNLAATGDQAKLAAFRQARQKIAQAHGIEDALVGEKVSAKELFKQLDKGVPLAPQLKTAAQFYERFPKSAQIVDSATKANPFSVMDAMMTAAPAMYTGLAHGALPGAAVTAMGIMARPLLRSGLMSGPYQRFMTTRPEQARGLLASRALNSDTAPWLAGLLGYQGAQ